MTNDNGRAAIFAAVLLLAGTLAHAALPETLPYGMDDLPVPPSPRQNQNSPKVVDLLGAQLNDPYPLTRVRLLTEIGACELPAGAKYIRQGLADAEPLVRAQAARSAAMVGDPSLADDLKKLRTDANVAVRRAVVESAAAMGVDQILSAALADSDPAVVAAAVAAARAAQGEAIANALPGYSPPLQVLAVRSLGRIGDARHAAAVAPFLTSDSVPARAAAAQAVGLMKAEGQAAAIEALLADKHATVRRVALTSLAELAPAATLQRRAIAALADPDLSVRENAAKLLEKSPTPAAIDALAANLPSESIRLHDAARLALVAVGAPAVPRAQQLLADDNPRRREDGSFILGRLKSDASFDKHVALLSDGDWGVRKQAATSLGLIGRKDAAAEMAKLAERVPEINAQPPDQIQLAAGAVEQAIVACAYLGEKSILPTCRKVLPNKNIYSSVRSAAAYAIGRLDSPNTPAAGSINRILNDQEDSGDVKFEGLKALGHLKSRVAASHVGADRNSAKFAGDARSDWLAHWVRFKITGKEQPYEPVPDTWTAPVSINVFEP